MGIPIPRLSSEAFFRERKTENPGLIFDRYALEYPTNTNSKRKALEIVCNAAKKIDSGLLNAYQERWENCVEAANADSFELYTDWRLVAGLGAGTALEIGFTFNRYGFPVLPGSSIKGVARAYALAELSEICELTLDEMDKLLSTETDKEFIEIVESNPDLLKNKLAMDDFRKIFGTNECAGFAVFFDGIPVNKPKLEIDIMNPHFPEYYQGDDTPPTNWQSPVPINFLTVAPDTAFGFAVGWRCKPIEEAQTLLEKAKSWLESGLTELGIGAKTTSGYGYFTSEVRQQNGDKSDFTRIKIPAGYRRGTVREFGLGPNKSYGYIIASNGEEIFFHRNSLPEGITSLDVDTKVYFRVEYEKGKNQAKDIHIEP